MQTERVYIAGCPVDCVTLEKMIEALAQIVGERDKRCQVLGVNAAFVVDASRDKRYREILESTTFVPADGFWVSAASKLLGFKGVGHVGIERLVYRLLERLAPRNIKVYLLGARQDVVEHAAAVVEARYKGLKVVGFRNGYFSEADEKEIVEEINIVQPDIVLVGMTSPKKELWMCKYRDKLRASLVVGVGGLFDVLAGKVPPAPEWIKRLGMEWLFRLAHDPKRLWKRYLIGNARFIHLVVKDLLRKP
jgi:N-acetylglucosaminyldiphosphoundecaprenol N-acetyl-beta-D-mannosaminyltransferase